MVAMLLVAVAAVAFGASTRAVALAADDARLVSAARVGAAAAAESLAAIPCGSGGLAATLGRVRIDVAAAHVGPVQRTRADVRLDRAPLAGLGPGALTLAAGRPCS
jgi:hypothetical protein